MKKLENLDLTVRAAELTGPKFRALAAKLRGKRESRNVTASQATKLVEASRKADEIDSLCQQLIHLALRLRLKRSLSRAAAQERAITPKPITDAQRKAHLEQSLATAKAQDIAAWQKGLIHP